MERGGMMEEEFEKIFRFAIRQQASDIHISRNEKGVNCEVRTAISMLKFRGVIDPMMLRYLKFKADLDLMDSHRPQTGHFEYQFMKKKYELRVAHVKTGNDENIVIRILNPYRTLTFTNLFEDETQKQTMVRLLGMDCGLILISGTTGSGKTTTLYHSLGILRPRKIVTIEDPIETRIEDVVQMQINPSQKFGFDDAIKQVLRHDPNVIVIGEIRDEVEAKAAVRCAFSGHLVISTIHAINATKTIDRMCNFGISKSELMEVLIGVIHQRMEVDPTGKRKVRFDIQTHHAIG